ncbi:MAG: hypothetical protein ABI877_21505, partial [Gemmatimonadaceae bacterium]
GLIARLRAPTVERDARLSSFLSGPSGTRGLADALGAVGIRVDRLRDRQSMFNLTDSTRRRAVLLLLSPVVRLSSAELASVTNAAISPTGVGLIAVDVNGSQLASCFGYGQELSVLDSLPVHEPGRPAWPRPATVYSVLHYSARDSVRKRTVAHFGELDPCLQVPNLATDAQVVHDTLLADDRGRPVVVRLRGGALSHDLVLVSDARLFRNKTLRDTDAGPFILSLITSSYDRVLFDEYHQGFGESGSLGGATLKWSLASPWGWGVWQVAVAAALALLAGAIRFGPVREVASRKRRSPQEHLRALATALASARGHQVAVGRLIMGLRRRLSPGGRAPRAKWRPWLQQLTQQATNPDTRAAAERLLMLTDDTAEPERVLDVAHAVEDVWTTMRR